MGTWESHGLFHDECHVCHRYTCTDTGALTALVT